MTDKEKGKYGQTKTVQYPKIVTQNQINILLLQALMEVELASLYDHRMDISAKTSLTVM